MPLHKSFTLNDGTRILIWKITESLESLFNHIQLKKESYLRLESMKSEKHQKAFLSVRKLLQKVGYSDFELYYTNNGKPHLIDNKYISITHSFDFSAIIISDNPVGIDIELCRDKIIKVANKFINKESSFLDPENTNYKEKLTIIWSAKEAMYKLLSQPAISFKEHLEIDPFEIGENKARIKLNLKKESANYEITHFIYFLKIEDFILVYITA